MRIKSDAQIYALILFYGHMNAIHSLVVVNVAALYQFRDFCDNVRISSLQQYPGTGLAALVMISSVCFLRVNKLMLVNWPLHPDHC